MEQVAEQAKQARWDGAVALQAEIAQQIGTAPANADLAPDLHRALGGVVYELDQAWPELHAVGAAPSNAEFGAAYEIHHAALLAWQRRRRPIEVARLVEHRRRDGADALARVPAACA